MGNVAGGFVGILLFDARHRRSPIEAVIVELVIVVVLLLVVRLNVVVLDALAVVILVGRRIHGLVLGMVAVNERVTVLRLVVAAFYPLHPRLVLLDEREQLVGGVVADVGSAAYRCASRHIRLTGVLSILAVQNRLYVLQAVRRVRVIVYLAVRQYPGLVSIIIVLIIGAVDGDAGERRQTRQQLPTHVRVHLRQ